MSVFDVLTCLLLLLSGGLFLSVSVFALIVRNLSNVRKIIVARDVFYFISVDISKRQDLNDFVTDHLIDDLWKINVFFTLILTLICGTVRLIFCD